MNIAPKIALLLAAILMVSCTNVIQESQTERLAGLVDQKELEHFVRTFSLEAPTRAILWAESRAATSNAQAAFRDVRFLPDEDRDWRGFIVSLYEERSWQPVFVRNAQLTAAGRVAVDAILSAHQAHAMDVSEWNLDELLARLEVLGSQEELAARQQALEFSVEDEGILHAWLSEHAGFDNTLPARDALARHLLTDDTPSPVPHWRSAADDLVTKLESVAIAAPELEYLIASAWLRFATELRHGNFNYIQRSVRSENGWNIQNDEQRDEILQALLREHFHVATREGFDVALDALQPPFEQYQALQRGLARYRQYVADGGWEKLPEGTTLSMGDEGPLVAALRRRLASEDYHDPDDVESEQFDRALRNSLINYQRTHQLNETGSVNSGTLTSLNISAERRLAQVAVSLERWRSTRAAHDYERDYILINIPDFHAELWDQDELVHRWRVVVGSTRRARNQRTRQVELADATPLFSRSMRYIVFNPYWNIPPGIRARVYEPEIAENPYYLEENGYELIVAEDGYEFIRQLPGPTNALGQVKFLFPNEHHVYMHDTPQRHLFNHTLRAYSAGCVRVQDPLELARILIQRDRNWTEQRTRNFIADELAKDDGEQWFNLQNILPVHIEYYVVRADEDGRMNFLADIYRHDQPLIEEMQLRLSGEVTEEDEDVPTTARLDSGP